MSDIRRMDLTGVGAGPMGPPTAGPDDTPFTNVLGNVLVAIDGPHSSYMSFQQQASEPANGEWILGFDIAISGGRTELVHPGVASLSWTIVLAAPGGGGFGWRIDSSGPGRLRIRDNLNAQLGAESTTLLAAGVRYRIEWSIDATRAEVLLFLGDDVTPIETMIRTGTFGPAGVFKFGPTTSSPTVPGFAMDSILVNDDGTLPGPWTPRFGDYDFRVDWNNDGGFEGAGEDITARVLGMRSTPQIQYGRDQIRSLAPSAAGRLSGVEVDNASRDYSPENPTSPLVQNIKAGRELWVGYNERANLVPNPSFEVNTAGWTDSNLTLLRVATTPFVGDWAGRVEIDSVGATPTVNTIQFPVIPGRRYTASVYAKLITVGTRSIGVKMIFVRANGSIAFNPATVFGSVSNTDDYERPSKSDVAPIDASRAQITIAFSTGDAVVGDSWNIDGAMVEESATVDSYFDGDSEGAYWRAEAHNSASLIGTVLFRGHLEDFDLQPDISSRSVSIGGLDGLARFREVNVSSALFAGIRSGRAVHEVLHAIGWPVDKRDVDTGGTQIAWWWEEGTDALTALERIVASEGPGALITMGPSGEVVFRDRHHRLLRPASIASQATFRDLDGSDGLRVTGNANSRASTPDHASLDIVADIDIRVRVAMDDWTPGVFQAFVGKNGAAVGSRSYVFYMNASNLLELRWSADGTNNLVATATRPTGFVNGSLHWIRAALDVNNGAGGRTITFYTSENGVNWVTLGIQVVQAGTTSVFAGSSTLDVGSRGDNAGDYLVGNVHEVQIRAGINGTLVASPNFAAQLAGTVAFGDAQGRPWTVNTPSAITGAAEPKHSAPLGYDAGLKEVYNHVAFDVEERRPSSLAVVWETDETFVVPDNGDVIVLASMSDPVIEAETPSSANSDFAVLNGVAVSAALQRTSGQSIRITLTNNGAADAIVAGLRLRARPVPVARTVKVEVEDSASIAEHKRRTYPNAAPWAGRHDAAAIGELILHQRAQRAPTVAVRVLASPIEQPERFFPAVRRDISDKVRVLDSESGIDAHFYVEQIAHTIHQVGLQHEVVLGCERIPATTLDEPSEVFVLDSATNGILDTNRLGY